ncbi:hypothetical protein [Williamsia sterculiae]|uniref:Uncharacterized protein n=1 Tax=Williamsia sterculiae TaxID=1344003 RepID=A0A1N7GSK1_9NOCA|nr:hypothetical protein [Williamsia sterculiae]SIS15542.1 hypothetical protein SAMN05445060_3082 [Williamsia sterculiae]
MASASSRNGDLSVVTTDEGLPTTVSISDAAAGRDAAVLSREILGLCRRSAVSAGVGRRVQLQEAGVESGLIDAMGLPTADDLAKLEMADDLDTGDTATWMRSVR